MAKVKQDFLDNLESLQTDYAECKINTEQFEIENLKVPLKLKNIKLLRNGC